MLCSCNNISEKYIYHILILLNAVQIIFGIILIIISEYYKQIINHMLVDGIEKNEFNIHIIIIEFYGIHIIICYCWSFSIINNFFYNSYTIYINFILKLWFILIFIISFDGFLMLWLMANSLEYLKISIELSMYTGMNNYYTDSEWRYKWDNFQYIEQCCGLNNYTDWKIIIMENLLLTDNFMQK